VFQNEEIGLNASTSPSWIAVTRASVASSASSIPSAFCATTWAGTPVCEPDQMATSQSANGLE